MNTSAIGTMLFGSVPTPPRKPRSSTRTQSARQRTTPATTPQRTTGGSPGEERGPDQGQGQYDKEVDGPTVGGVEISERRYPGGKDVRLRCLGHLPDHPGERPQRRPWTWSSLPETSARPGLEDGHAHEEQAQRPQHEPAQTRRGPVQKRGGRPVRRRGNRTAPPRAPRTAR